MGAARVNEVDRSTTSRRSLAIAGLGAVGWAVARMLDAQDFGLDLVAVSSGDANRAESKLRTLRQRPDLVEAGDLVRADIVLEAAPAHVFAEIAEPVIARGGTLVVCSSGALLRRPDLIQAARASGARILVPSGALAGLDAVRAAALGTVAWTRLESHKAVLALTNAPHVLRSNLDLTNLSAPVCIFRGNALQAAEGFPANANVAASLALAGLGPEAIAVEIWAHPQLRRTRHTLTMESEAGCFSLTSESEPAADNPRTSRLTALSVVACLKGLLDPLRVGS